MPLRLVFTMAGMMARVMGKAYVDTEVIVVSGPLLLMVAFLLIFHLFMFAGLPFAILGFSRWRQFAYIVMCSWGGFGLAGMLLKV